MVRNFWITLDVDGSKTQIAMGPRSKDGGFNLTIRQRDGGGIITAVDVWGHAQDDGTITLHVKANDPAIEQMTITTRR